MTENSAPPSPVPTKTPVDRMVWLWVGALGLLVLVLSPPLLSWFRYALKDDLYSHVVMVPLIAGYLVWWHRRWPPPFAPVHATRLILGAIGIGLSLALGYGVIQPFGGSSAHPIDAFAGSMLGLVIGLGTVTWMLLGNRGLLSLLGPVLMMLFVVPFPEAWLLRFETFLQHGSAGMAAWLFQVADTPVLISGLILKLPGISVEVARECSGIHSTLVLFVTATTASLVFLSSPPTRAALIAFALPLAVVRNGFRVFTLGELAIRLGPDVLDSWIHHDGGPIFFAISLVPLAMVLFLLRWAEKRWWRAPDSPTSTTAT